PQTGGGAPAAPSRIHTPPPPKQPRPPELPAPPKQAPVPAPVVGVAPAPSPNPGFGQGGQGAGSGSGVGPGSGLGGGSTGPRLVTGPTMGQIRANHPPAARSRYGRAELSCLIRLDSRLDDCRVVDETPPGLGFGAAGLQVSGLFRFQPPTENGRPVEGQRVTVGVDFGRPPR
ncbi:energy transducer TonB, partial [Brevundimonas sp. UBA5718]